MKTLRLTVPGVISQPQFGKFTPVPDLHGKLFAAYLLGSNYGIGHSGLEDWSGNGHHITAVTGTPIGDKYLTGGQNSYVDTPFNGTQLGAHTGKASIFTLFQCDPALLAGLVSNLYDEPPAFSMSLVASSPNLGESFRAMSYAENSLVPRITPSDPNRGTVWSVAGGVFLTNKGPGQTAYRKPVGGVTTSAYLGTANLAAMSGGPFRIGRLPADFWYGPNKQAAVLFYNDEVSASEFEEIAASMLAIPASNNF